MILNSFAVLDGSLSLLRLIAGLFVVGFGMMAWRAVRREPMKDKMIADGQHDLLALVAILLLGLNVVSWPLFYLLLQSYIPEWPGVMCIYGVTRIGEGSEGAARFLPALVEALQWLKPLLVFVTGAWFVLYTLNRQAQTGPLIAHTLFALILCGVVTTVDAGVELTYLTIPKKEVWRSTGCCAGAFTEHTGEHPPADGIASPLVTGAFFVTSLGIAASLLVGSNRPGCSRRWLVVWLAGAGVAFALGRTFLSEVAAPTILHTPYHHCPYDLLPGAPETLLGIALFAWGTLCVGWAFVAGCFGGCVETEPFLGPVVGRIVFMGFCCYLGAAVMAAVELALA